MGRTAPLTDRQLLLFTHDCASVRRALLLSVGRSGPLVSMPGETSRPIRVGDVAPDFELPDQSGTPVRLRELVGQRAVVLYFYPKDGTPGCTLEARAFQNRYDRFTLAGARVVGISSDSVASHRRFAAHQQLSFPLLSDRAGAVRTLYGVEKTLGILPGRVTYVIDPAGVVRHIFSSQLQATRHSREALGALEELSDAR
jgi:peroxiredoxin Q/BCP